MGGRDHPSIMDPLPQLKKGPKWLRESVSGINAAIVKNRPVAGVGTKVYDSPGGRVIDSDSSTGSALASSAIHPFKTYLRTDPENPEQYQAKVFLGSNLYNGLGNWSNTAITGLDSWFNVSENDYIYLTGAYVDSVLETVDVDSGSSLPGRIVITTGDNPTQTSWTTRIARILVIDDAWTVEQNLFQHLTLLEECVASVSVEYPFPVS